MRQKAGGAARLPPDNEITLLLTVTVPPQPGPDELGAERPAGKVSEKLMPVKPPGFPDGFVIVIERVDVCPVTMVLGENDLLILGGAKALNDAVAAELFVPVSVVNSDTELFFGPPVVATTETLKLQPVLAPSTAPERLMEDALAVAVMVPPPQDPVTFGEDATCNPAGKESVKPTPVRLFRVSLFVMLNVRPTGVPTATEGALKLFVNVGAARTLSVALLLATPAFA
jgi:hypothetical protein